MSRELRVAISQPPAANSLRWKPTTTTWEEFPALIRLDEPGDVKDCGGIFGGSLRGSQKKNEFVEARSLLYLDADKAKQTFLVDLELTLGGTALAWHTTWSHTALAPRYRVYVLPDRDMTPEEASLVTRALMREIGRDQFDASCAEPARMMFLPAAQNGSYRSGFFEGDPLDVDEWLLVADALGLAEERERFTSGAMTFEPDDGAPPHPMQVDKAEAILKKAAREVREQAQELYGGRNNALTRWLPNLYRLVLGGCLPEDRVDETMREAVEAADGPDPWTDAEWASVSAHAHEYADESGGGRPTTPDAHSDFGKVLVPTAVFDPGDDDDDDDAAPPPPSQDILDLFQYGPTRWTRQGGGLSVEPLARFIDAAMPVGVDLLDKRLLVYRNGVWRDGEDDVAAAIAVIFGDMWTEAIQNKTMAFMRVHPAFPRLAREPNETVAPFVNCRNGMVDWATGMVLPHDPRLRSVTQIPWSYRPEARCPEFDVFLKEVLPDDDTVAFVWEVIGYMLYSGNPLHKMILMWGRKGRNGKGTLLRVLNALLGEANCTSIDLHSLATDKFRAAELYGRSANIAGDIDAKYLDSPAILKGMTGGDKMTADRKFGQPFAFTPWAVPIFSANAMFGVNDSSEAFFARWLVVPFPRTFLGHEDTGLSARLMRQNEIEGVLAKGIEALARLMARGAFLLPDAVVAAGHEMAKAGDPVRRWLDEYCDLTDRDAWTPQTALYNAYLMADDHDGPRMQRHKFYARLDQIGTLERRQRRGVRGYLGVAVKDSDEVLL